MATAQETVRDYTGGDYKHGFVTDVEEDRAPIGLDEATVRFISEKKAEPAWLAEWRLGGYRRWLQMEEPSWQKPHYPPIDYQAISYYSAPKQKEGPKSLDEIDPEIRSTYDKLGIPIKEQEILAGVAVDYVFDSVSVATTFRKKLSELGVVFCSISEAVQDHPDLVRRYLGSVVPQGDISSRPQLGRLLRWHLRLRAQGRALPDGAVDLLPHQCGRHGQFERTLIADEGSYVSYLEGCTAPMRDENQLHAAVVELVALDNAQIKYSTVQNWYPGDKEGRGRHLQFRHQARRHGA